MPIRCASRKRLSGAISGICAVLLLWVGNSWGGGAGPREIQLTLAGTPGGALYGVQGEFASGINSSMTGRIAGFAWDYEEDSYSEEGAGVLIGAGIRFYTDDLMEGTYFGLNLDYVSAEADWYEYPSYGTVTVSGIVPGATLGHKFLPRNQNLSIEPHVYLAFLPGDIEAGVIIAAGVNIGMKF